MTSAIEEKVKSHDVGEKRKLKGGELPKLLYFIFYSFQTFFV